MAGKERKIIRRRIVNAYVSSVISIALVLLLVGLTALLAVNARCVADYFKENMQISVIMKPAVDEAGAEEYKNGIKTLPFVNTTRTVTREEGTNELKALLGEDFLNVFESSPVPVSVSVTLKADYVSADSLSFVKAALAGSPLVEEVSCQQSLVDALSSNMRKISVVIGGFILVLLFISYVLINNTVRINVFARRFTIHTMKLVGATKGFITAPFVKAAVWQGLVSAAVAIIAITGGLFYVRRSLPELFAILDVKGMAVVLGIVVVAGVLICVLSTVMVVGRLLRLNKDELYF